MKASNGEIVATGEAYTTKAGVKDGIDAVKRARQPRRRWTTPPTTERRLNASKQLGWPVLIARAGCSASNCDHD